MSKIKHKNQNPFLLEEMAAYIEENGFTRSDKIGATQFMKDDKAIVLYGDKVSFRVFDAGENSTDSAEFIERSNFEGLSTLNIGDWILLLHVVRMITIPELLSNIKKQTPVVKFNIMESLEETIQTITKVQRKIYLGVFVLIFFLFNTASAQTEVTAQMRVGYSFKTVDALISPSLNFSAHNITLAPEMLINTKDDAPVLFGIKASYQIAFVEVGAARYFALFSTDAYDKSYANGWVNSAFVAAHYNKWFMQAEYSGQFRLSIGVREIL